MQLRIPVVVAIIATTGAFLGVDHDAADTGAPAPGASRQVATPALPAAAPAPAPAASAQRSWFAAIPVSPERAPMPPTIRNAADVVSPLPPARAIHPSLVGKLSRVQVRTAERRAGDRIEARAVEARAGDAMAPRYGDTVVRN